MGFSEEKEEGGKWLACWTRGGVPAAAAVEAGGDGGGRNKGGEGGETVGGGGVRLLCFCFSVTPVSLRVACRKHLSLRCQLRRAGLVGFRGAF